MYKELEIEMKLENVYGGDGYTYKGSTKSTKLERTKTVEIRRDIGVPKPSVKTETKTENKAIDINTFKFKDDVPTLRLGGYHGKLWGAMKQSGMKMFDCGEIKKVRVECLMDTTQINPEMATLELNGHKIGSDCLYVARNTYPKTVVPEYYDVIPECTTKVIVRYLNVKSSNKGKSYTNIIKDIIQDLEEGYHFNKRRTKIKISSIKELN